MKGNGKESSSKCLLLIGVLGEMEMVGFVRVLVLVGVGDGWGRRWEMGAVNAPIFWLAMVARVGAEFVWI